jgi:predicted regulator of Ras-like GTPase activity (Roadblock/LC7/MglB family)
VAQAAQTKFHPVLDGLRQRLEGSRAVVIVGKDGVLDHVIADQGADVDTLAGEYGTLVQIATRTSRDAGAGNLVEHIVVSDNYTVVARNISPDHFLIVFFQKPDQIGRARYELKTAAREITRLF